uniref:Tc1-like transposase DDE domain-containing protein n=2 Tax=Caenorhabditis japonica TaxID=281687 RepID=A0A8R1HU47_CAEJA
MVTPSVHRGSIVDLHKRRLSVSGDLQKAPNVEINGLQSCFSETVTLSDRSRSGRLTTVTTPTMIKTIREILRSFPPSQYGVMVFGAISATGQCPLVSVDEGVKINQKNYMDDILVKHLLPWTNTHFGQHHCIFQPDGAPAHIAKSTQEWCKANLPAFIKKENSSASSPDFNQLDYSVWGVLQNKVCARPHSSVEALKKTLLEECDKLPDEYLHATVEAYPRRLRDVIKAEGSRIK